MLARLVLFPIIRALLIAMVPFAESQILMDDGFLAIVPSLGEK
jgi:hypothetical protein